MKLLFLISTLLQKVASAVGLSDKKPISDGEDMGPAGHMQGRSDFLQLKLQEERIDFFETQQAVIKNVVLHS